MVSRTVAMHAIKTSAETERTQRSNTAWLKNLLTMLHSMMLSECLGCALSSTAFHWAARFNSIRIGSSLSRSTCPKQSKLTNYVDKRKCKIYSIRCCTSRTFYHRFSPYCCHMACSPPRLRTSMASKDPTCSEGCTECARLCRLEATHVHGTSS